MKRNLRKGQQGVTLIVGLIMLILITLMVTTAFTLNTNNLKSIGNMQFRNESVMAAGKGIEQVVATQFPVGFLSVPPAQTITYDINNDGTADYTVQVAKPECVEAIPMSLGGAGGACSGIKGGGLAGCPPPNYTTLWDMQATVSDITSGAAIVLKQGVRIEITSVQKDAVCAI